MKSGHPHPWHGAERLVHPNHCEGPPGGQVVKILRFQCRGSDQGTKLLIIHSMMWQAPIFFLTEKKNQCELVMHKASLKFQVLKLPIMRSRRNIRGVEQETVVLGESLELQEKGVSRNRKLVRMSNATERMGQVRTLCAHGV